MKKILKRQGMSLLAIVDTARIARIPNSLLIKRY